MLRSCNEYLFRNFSVLRNFSYFTKITSNRLFSTSTNSRTVNSTTLNSGTTNFRTVNSGTTNSTGDTRTGETVRDEKFAWRHRVVGAQTNNNLKVGPYKRGRWFVSYREDPGSFITNILIILVTGYAIFTLLPGESMRVRRQRKLRQMLLDKANLTEAELDYIENYQFKSKPHNN
uniref:Transmembrane protein n=1 Tax=Theileria parva TaxID=5875 RepID=Q4N1C9_THEPA|eukprot:XP_764454.1 hypothetical protein [Theileria parva strain Muguga]